MPDLDFGRGMELGLGQVLSGLGRDERIASALWIAAAFLAAWVVHRLADRLAWRLANVSSPGRKAHTERARLERRQTLQGILSDAISFFAFAVAFLVALVQGGLVAAENLIWVIGLLSAGIGFAAKPFIADFFSGLSFLLGDRFVVGEKLQIPATMDIVEGVVERTNLLDTRIRARSGELIVVPNGEIRVIRNFSRGLYSLANVRLKVRSHDIEKVLQTIEDSTEEALVRLPELIEPWKLISEEGTIGGETELTLVAKARFGTAAELRPRILAFLQRRLTEAEVSLAD